MLLLAFIPLEIYYITSSKYANIPWGPLNIFRIVITTLVCAITLSDLIMGIVRAGDGAYDVHIVTPAVKLISFVSQFIYDCYEWGKVNFRQLFHLTATDGIISAFPSYKWHCVVWYNVFLLVFPRSFRFTAISNRNRSLYETG